MSSGHEMLMLSGYYTQYNHAGLQAACILSFTVMLVTVAFLIAPSLPSLFPPYFPSFSPCFPSLPSMAHVLLQVDVLKHTDNRGSFYDNSSMLAAALEALGHLRLPDFKSLQPVTKQLNRFLAREKVLPSYHAEVAQAALRAFVELALSVRPTAASLISRCSASLISRGFGTWVLGLLESD